MAASTSPSQRNEDFKDQFLTCSLCFEPYDNTENQAKFLPCLHSYCKSCLQQHAGKRPKFKCPKCRIVVHLADGTIDSLPNDFIVENLKEYQDIFNLAAPCGNCDEGNHAVSFCHDCGFFVCEKCVDYHRKVRSLRQHKFSTMEELKEEKYNPTMQQRCKKHPTMPLNLYCKNADCKIAACASCGLIDHRGHEIIDLTAALGKIVADMRQSSAHVVTRNLELTRKRAAVNTMQKTLTDNFHKTEKAMQGSVQKLHSVIDSRYDKAHSHLKQLFQAEMNQLTESNESIDLLATQMTSACEFANKACDTSHSAQLLTAQDQIMERLYELENAALPATESDKTDFVLISKHYSAIEQIEVPLKNVCVVDWWKPPQLSKELEDAMMNLEEEKVPTLEQRLNDHSLSNDEILTVVTAERKAFDKKLEVTRKKLTDFKFSSSEQIAVLEQHISHLNAKITEDSEKLKSRESGIADQEEKHRKEMEELNQGLLDRKEQASENAGRVLIEKETQLAAQKEAFDKKLEVTMSELSNLRSSSSEQIAALEQQNANLNTKITEDGEELKSRERRIAELVEQHRKDEDDLNQGLLAHEKQASDNEWLLIEKETQLAIQREDVDKKLEEVRTELSALRSSSSKQIAALEQQITNLNTKITEDSEELTSRERKIADLEEQYRKKTEEWNKRLLAHEKQASDNETLLIEKETQLAIQREDVDQKLDVARTELSALRSSSSKQIAALEQQIAILNKKITEDSEELKSRERKIADLEEQHKKETQDWNKRLLAHKKQASDETLLIEKETQLAIQKEDVDKKLEVARTDLSALRSSNSKQITALEQQIALLNTKLTEDGEELKSRERKIADLEEQYRKETDDWNKGQLAHEKQASDNETLLIEKETQLAIQREDVDQKLEVARTELSALRSSSSKQIAALEQQIAILNTKITEDSEELKSRERKIADLEEQYRKKTEEWNKSVLAHEKQASDNETLLIEKEIQLAIQVDPRQCTIQLGQSSYSGYHSATIQTVDLNGQLMTTGGVVVEATLGGNELDVQDNNDGIYTFRYLSMGRLLRVNLNGSPMKGSPFDT